MEDVCRDVFWLTAESLTNGSIYQPHCFTPICSGHVSAFDRVDRYGKTEKDYRIDSLEILLIKKIYDAQEKYNR